jgi:hypothetical protein
MLRPDAVNAPVLSAAPSCRLPATVDAVAVHCWPGDVLVGWCAELLHSNCTIRSPARQSEQRGDSSFAPRRQWRPAQNNRICVRMERVPKSLASYSLCGLPGPAPPTATSYKATRKDASTSIPAARAPVRRAPARTRVALVLELLGVVVAPREPFEVARQRGRADSGCCRPRRQQGWPPRRRRTRRAPGGPGCC